MDRAFLTGNLIYLRPIDIQDADGPYLQWVNSPTAYLTLGTLYYPTTKAGLESYISRQCENPDSSLFAIITKNEEQFIGTAKIGPVEAIHRHAYIGIFIGEETERGKGYGREAVNLLLNYGFCQLNLHKISAGANATNTASIRLFEQVGMKVDCIRGRQLFVNGQWEDQVLLATFGEGYLEKQA